MRHRRIGRRTFVRNAFSVGASLAAPWSKLGTRRPTGFGAQPPAVVRSDSALPRITHGVAAGDVHDGRAVVWSRADRPSRLLIEYATSDSFRDVRRVRGPAALGPSDFTARVVLTDLPPGQRIFYRATFQDLEDLRAFSQPGLGSFVTPEAAATSGRNVTIAFSADTVGQGWGINPDWGGLRLYETMRRAQPDVFINLGDTIYADQPLEREVKLDDGTMWRNVVTEAKSKPAQSIDEFRGAFQYNLQDESMRRFNAEVAQIVLWDDHEVRDNWYPTRDLRSDERYTEKSVAMLAARGQQAFREYNPLPIDSDDPERIYRTVRLGPLVEVFALDLRSYRGPNSPNRQAMLDEGSALMGRAQLDWLKARLAASRATWKIIASDLPIGLVVPDGATDFEAFANADPGAPLGRELEIAELLRYIKARRVRNTVWITADVHYCAAHHYEPTAARFTEFEPFWEFVAGPLHAGTFGPNALDPTFGPTVKFTGIPPGMKPNRPPSQGLQFYGLLRVNARTQALTASLHDLTGKSLYSVELAAAS